MPFQRSTGTAGSAEAQRCLVDGLARHRHDVIRRAPQNIPRRAVERRSLVAGPLAQHVAQPQENKDGQSQKNDGVNIHVAFTF